MNIAPATDATSWDAFLSRQRFRPLLQCWTMGEVYRDIGQEPIRLMAEENGVIRGICFGHIVPARRGRHIAIPYGPIIDDALEPTQKTATIRALLDEMKIRAKAAGCSFVRVSPFVPKAEETSLQSSLSAKSSPLHLLAEHVWYLPLKTPDPWLSANHYSLHAHAARTEEELLAPMRKTTRNLIRRAERDGVTIEASQNPNEDLGHFLRLHDETRARHGFTAYTNEFFRSQVKRFSAEGTCTLYLARFQGEVIAASIHMHAFGETSYHHGASSAAHSKIPASYAVQWRAISDALKRGDHVYNFWGIAPISEEKPLKKHPFSGVTLFKTGFGGEVLNLAHCMDIPVSTQYWLTHGFEMLRKWRRGF